MSKAVEQLNVGVDLGATKVETVLVALAGSLERVTTAIIAQAYREGDPFARGLIGETGQYLVVRVVGIVNALNPSVLILGGGVIEGLRSRNAC